MRISLADIKQSLKISDNQDRAISKDEVMRLFTKPGRLKRDMGNAKKQWLIHDLASIPTALASLLDGSADTVDVTFVRRLLDLNNDNNDDKDNTHQHKHHKEHPLYEQQQPTSITNNHITRSATDQ